MTTKEIINRLLDIAYTVKETDHEAFIEIMKLIADIVMHETENS